MGRRPGLASSAAHLVVHLLGVTEQAINAETRTALIKHRAGLRELELEVEDL